MSYGDIIRDAFWIAWRNRFMWFFGFFVSGALGSFVSPTNFGTFGAETPASGSPLWLVNLFGWIQENVILFAVLAAVLVLLLVTIWLALYVISRGALAEGVAAIDRGEERTFSPAWRAGVSHFWPVAGQVTVISLICSASRSSSRCSARSWPWPPSPPRTRSRCGSSSSCSRRSCSSRRSL